MSSLGEKIVRGQDNDIYLRIWNRNEDPAEGVTATVYWAPNTTLRTPDGWRLIGTTDPINFELREDGSVETFKVAGPLTWPEEMIAELPEPHELCRAIREWGSSACH